MVCKLFYVSEYIQGCDISKFGEGCEKCVPLFKSSWMTPIILIEVICCIIGLAIILSKFNKGGCAMMFKRDLIKVKQYCYCKECGKKILDMDKFLWIDEINKISEFKFSSLYKLTTHELHSLFDTQQKIWDLIKLQKPK